MKRRGFTVPTGSNGIRKTTLSSLPYIAGAAAVFEERVWSN